MAATLTGLLSWAPAYRPEHHLGLVAPAGAVENDHHHDHHLDFQAQRRATPSSSRKPRRAAWRRSSSGSWRLQKASNADVKSFGQHMVDDHSKANDQLKQLASQKGVTLPAALSPPSRR